MRARTGMTAFTLLTALQAAAFARAGDASSGRRTVIEEKGFSIVGPDGWEIRERALPADVAFVGPRDAEGDSFRANALVMSQPSSGAASAEALLASSLAKNADHVEVIERGALPWGEASLPTAVYRETSAKGPRTQLVAAAVGNGREYLVMCFAASDRFAALRPQFEALARSLRLQAVVEPPPGLPVRKHEAGLGISFVMPAGWVEIDRLPTGTVSLQSPKEPAPDDFREQVVLTTGDVPASVTLDALQGAWFEVASSQFQDLHVTATADEPLDGVPSRRMSATGRRNGQPVALTLVLSTRGSRSLIVTCFASPSSAERFAAVFGEFLGSIRWE